MLGLVGLLLYIGGLIPGPPRPILAGCLGGMEPRFGMFCG